MIVRINEFQAADGRAEELHTFLKSLGPFITSSEGCLACEVLRNVDVPGSFAVIERWQDIDSHKRSLARVPKEQFQAAMKLFGAPPKGTYYSA